jgi:hypothetical protein
MIKNEKAISNTAGTDGYTNLRLSMARACRSVGTPVF